MIHIADERISDTAAREALLDQVMPDRFLKPSHQLRQGRAAARGLSLVARDRDGLVGSVRLWEVTAGGRPALLLGPLAIAPDLQGKGVGGGLMRVALNRAGLAGHAAVILVGDPDYYERFGFTAAPASGLVMPAPVDRRRLLGLELAEGGLRHASGRVVATSGPVARHLRQAA